MAMCEACSRAEPHIEVRKYIGVSRNSAAATTGGRLSEQRIDDGDDAGMLATISVAPSPA